MRPRPTAKEVYVATLLFIVGTLLLAVQASSYFAGSSATVNDDTITLSRSELFSDIRTFVTLAAIFIGAIGLLRIKKIGWILSLAMLMVLLLWTSAGWKYILQTPDTLGLVLVPVGTVILVIGLLFLLLPSTRERFLVTPRVTLLGLAIGLAMISMHWFLQ